MKMAGSGDADAEDKLLHVKAPPPSIYYTKYTNNNIRNGTAPLPPPIPVGSFTSFGISHQPDDPGSILAPLREHGVTQLYQDTSNDIKELKKLNSSFVVNFLDLLDIMIQCPSSPERIKKLEDLELLFCNFHHLVNKFRPHQALETLIQMVKIQKEQKLELIEQINSKMESARASLHTTINSLPSFLAHTVKVESQENDMEHSGSTNNHSLASLDFDNVLDGLETIIDKEIGDT